MSKFIEIKGENEKRHLINVDYIEEVEEASEEKTFIYLAFNCPDSTAQDYFIVNKPYDEIVSMILKGGANNDR